MNSLILLAVIMGFLLFMSVPIAVAIGLGTLAAIWWADISFTFFAQRLFNLFDSFPLMAVPFFILAGEILQRGTLAESLLQMCKALTGHLRGGLAYISVLTCLFYGALCGSGGATVAAVGGMMIPAMVRDGYPRDFSTALNTAAGSLGMMIPPSIPLILIGAFGGISITKLFIAGVVPGILFALLFMLTAYLIIRAHGFGKINPSTSAMEKIRAVWGAKWALGVPLIVLGGIYGGIVTPTEGGVIAVFYALLVEIVITRKMTLAIFRKCLQSTLCVMGAIFFVMITAFAMGALLQYYSLESSLIAFMQQISPNLTIWLLIMIAILVVLGMFIDATALILILTPLLVPMALRYGMDPIQFGIVMLICVSIGYITPPVAVMVYVGCSVGKIGISEITASLYPFILAMLVGLLLVAFIPFLSLMFL